MTTTPHGTNEPDNRDAGGTKSPHSNSPYLRQSEATSPPMPSYQETYPRPESGANQSQVAPQQSAPTQAYTWGTSPEPSGQTAPMPEYGTSQQGHSQAAAYNSGYWQPGYPTWMPGYGVGAPQPSRAPEVSFNAMGLVSLIFAIIALAVCWIPMIGFFGEVPALCAVGFGIAGVSMDRYRNSRALAVVGLVLGVVAMVLAFFMPFLLTVLGMFGFFHAVITA